MGLWNDRYLCNSQVYYLGGDQCHTEKEHTGVNGVDPRRKRRRGRKRSDVIRSRSNFLAMESIRCARTSWLRF